MATYPKRRLFVIFFLLFISSFLLLAGRVAYFAFTPAAPGSQEQVVVEISKGQGPSELARMLASKNIITDAKEFVFLGRLTREWKKIKAGEYQVSPGQTPAQVFGVITSGISINHPITVREGENMYDIAADLASKRLASKDKFLSLCKSPKLMMALGFTAPLPPSLEGYLYPETYFFNRTLSIEDMIRQMVRKFQATWGSDEENRARELGMTRHQIVTLASIIEKETGAPSERPIISSVFHNRLQKHMRLQSDPTTIYGMWDRFAGKIHKTDLSAYSPYNTYTIPALPVGPIANPGKEAIHAALFPVRSEFLFFVSHNDGTHEFTRTYGEHTRAVGKFQLDPKAREGKSWRDLKATLKQAQPSAPAVRSRK